MRAKDRQSLVGRAELTLIGALAGLAMWVLIEKAPDVLTNPHLFLTVASAVAGYFAVLLALAGPANIRRAGIAAGVLSLPAAGLAGWASMRFDTLEAFFDAGHPVIAWIVLLFVGTPFLAAWLERPRGVWDYARLFDCAWGIVVRYGAAWLFVGVFWAVVFLSDALLQLVGVSIIEDLLDHELVPHLIVGAVLGLALAVVYEMRDYLSPFLLLRLLRLLVPVMLLVVIVFVGALLLRGPGTLLGGLSPTATLLAVALGMVSLVSIAIDKKDDRAVRAGWMRKATALLALLLPVIGGMAAYALWLRVAEHGWTPGRLSAVVIAAFVLAYALSYAAAVALRGVWMARIRQANMLIAGGILGACAVWLTPLLNAEAIAARSQMARIMDGRVEIGQAAVWEMTHEWGRPGRAALERGLANAGDKADALQKAMVAAETERAASISDGGLRGEAILALLQVLPDGAAPGADVLGTLPAYLVEDWQRLCSTARAPGCVLVMADFNPSRAGDEGIVFLPGRNETYDAMHVWIEAGRMMVGSYIGGYGSGILSRSEVAAIAAGEYRLAPSSRRSLWIGEKELFPEN